MADIFGGWGGDGNKPAFKTNFNINRYISNSTNKTVSSVQGTTLTKNDVAELDRTLKAIEAASNKTVLEYERLYRELVQKRKELKVTIEAMAGSADAKGLAELHQTDIDLMNIQLRLIDSKIKASQDKFKNIRDEKKMYIDKSKSSGVVESQVPTVNLQNINSPIAYTGNQDAVRNIVTGDAIQGADVVTNTSSNSLKEVSERPQATLNEVLNRNKEDVSISETIIGTPTATLASHESAVNNVISDRLNKLNDDKVSYGTKGPLDVHLDTSLNALKTKNIEKEEVMYIDKYTGRFYCKAFTKDDNGNFTVPMKEYAEPGVAIVGSGLKFSPVQKTVKPAFCENAFRYELVEDDTDMSDGYKAQWSKPNNDEFMIDSDLLKKI
jgi:hypothetical protein